MTDSAIAKELGQRLEQMRLEANKPQKAIADELGYPLVMKIASPDWYFKGVGYVRKCGWLFT